MDVLELVLVLLVCVIVAAGVDHVVHKVSLPLLQIAVGLVAALVVPLVTQADVELDSELFLMLFIAPLLFNEARNASRTELWDKRRAIASMAVGLVLLTVLVVGFSLHWLVPSIPLAAAFACAGALGPTDAAAVGALKSTVNLTTRQRTLLSGEALINDASGVVSFDFAIAAALTGAFSLVEAVGEFLLLFFGGVAFGLVAGLVAVGAIAFMRSHGFDDATVNVLYEVATPFVVFLLAETLGVSGILAVVACGLVMARRRPALVSSDEARYRMVSNSFWEVIVYLINGVVFVLLGMQLVDAFSPTVSQGMSLARVVLVIVAVTALVIGTRFAWVGALDLVAKDPDTGRRGWRDARRSLHGSLVTTVAGPKGAVTLSIIFTLPHVMPDGSPFPERDLIIFLTAGVILLTLVAADVFLPILAPRGQDAAGDEEAVRKAGIAVIKATIDELEARIRDGSKPEYEPATRNVIASYRVRLERERLSGGPRAEVMRGLIDETMAEQQRRADELQDELFKEVSPREAAPYLAALRSIRASVGYRDGRQRVGSRGLGIRGTLELARWRSPALRPKGGYSDRVYYRTCVFARDLEQTAAAYLRGVEQNDPDGQRRSVARMLERGHQASIRSLDQRLEHGHDSAADTGECATDDQRRLREQFHAARKHADAVKSGALAIELGKIRRMEDDGSIGSKTAGKLRENVYLLQMDSNS